jgi:UPF0716 family protein affecting phage T7 exclusion
MGKKKKKANAPSTENRTFPFIGVSASRAIKTEAQPLIEVKAQIGCNLTIFLLLLLSMKGSLA